eukprot:5084604-Pleurochrysis_carterae.AAC.1
MPLRSAPPTSGIVNIQMMKGNAQCFELSMFHSRLHTQRCGRAASPYERQVWRRRPASRCIA